MTNILSSIRAKNISFFYEIHEPILSSVNFHISPGEKVALMGRNGAGKSSLAKILAGKEKNFDGELFIPKGVSVVYSEQNIDYADYSLSLQEYFLSKMGILKDVEDYFVVTDVMQFKQEFYNLYNGEEKSWNNVSEMIVDYKKFLSQQKFEELQVSDECAVEIMLELEEALESSDIQEREKCFYATACDFLQTCSATELVLSHDDFLQKFEKYFDFLVQASVYRKWASDHMNDVLDIFGEMQDKFEKSDGYILEDKMKKCLHIFHLESLNLDMPISLLSGGQKNKLMLAVSIFLEPDILILDEPTNNLDTVSYNRLQQFLQKFDKTCIIISHDPKFLEPLISQVLYIDSQSRSIQTFSGNYSAVQEEVALMMDRERSRLARVKKEAKRVKDLYQKRSQQASMTNSAQLASVAKRMKKNLEGLEAESQRTVHEERAIADFSIPCSFEGEIAVSMDSYSVYKDESVRSFSVNKEFPRNAKILIYGKNGLGKSWGVHECIAYAKEQKIKGFDILPSFEKINDSFQNKEERDFFLSQRWAFSDEVILGYYDQEFLILDYEKTVQQNMERIHPFQYQQLRQLLAQFLFIEADLDLKVQHLSEGQKALLSWSMVSFLSPNVLFLDEPTNHIHFLHIPKIIKAIQNYKGTLFVISHDVSFLEQISFSYVLDMEREKLFTMKEWKKRFAF
ncbi:hypothetical protein COB57_01075 [Candidatus Peregrinibacteria bacterium]|nr:MAG: hypothetical protein COB57_01075 [Candidatus Peregrinibacteria bacterium]